jgi:GNAT superfamily N-acetyltransferase
MSTSAELRFERRDYTDPDVQRLVAAVQLEYVQRYGGPDEAVVDPLEFAPPRGLFLVGLLDGEPVATGGWRIVDPGTAEIKRMFVVAAARRRGLSRLMLAELERLAHLDGITELVLNTGTEQPEAVALYESSGYRPVPGYGHYAGMPQALFYGRRLPSH